VVRFGRAAASVGRIGWDYQRTLFSAKYPTDEEYEAAKLECHQKNMKLQSWSAINDLQINF